MNDSLERAEEALGNWAVACMPWLISFCCIAAAVVTLALLGRKLFGQGTGRPFEETTWGRPSFGLPARAWSPSGSPPWWLFLLPLLLVAALLALLVDVLIA